MTGPVGLPPSSPQLPRSLRPFLTALRPPASWQRRQTQSKRPSMYATRPPRRTARLPRPSRPPFLTGPLDPLRAARDRIGLALLAADGVRRSALARVRRSRAGALAAPGAHRPRAAAGAARSAPGGPELRRRARLRQPGPRRPDGGAAAMPRRSPCSRRAPHGRASCMASAGCAISPSSGRWTTRRWRAALVEQWLAIPRRSLPEAWAPDVVAPAHALLARACGPAARRRRPARAGGPAAQPRGPGGSPVGLVARCAGGLSEAAGADRAGAIVPVHRRPRAPAGGRREAPDRRAQPADPGRRRPRQPQSRHAGGDAARPPAAAAMLRRARPDPGQRPHRRHRPHDGHAAPAAAG